MSFFIAEAAAQSAPAGQPGGFDFSSIIMLGGLFLFMYFMIIRPQRKRQKEHEQLTGGLKAKDEVVLNSGMLGTITAVDGDYITVKAGDNVELKFQKVAVHAVLPTGTIKEIAKSK